MSCAHSRWPGMLPLAKKSVVLYSPGLEREGKLEQKGRGWHPKA